ncbi:hypothetical protein PFICI_08589 [Pestalotiopsis fici W106-1]|uniref:MOSC domain-containing protein n=1 Tax=Pestalotiopsis fici (strain W106-1 / CGMCC3.15140) TaxID=1229662 RepID=W3X0S8_PESFW|nr:uncharacterized protein PFICI_08589 [Pestalotiopsis fici W106-1]ETS78736.1 hypothetical protein PFICI_08589 [Pestalotiopsis fici W106-1]
MVNLQSFNPFAPTVRETAVISELRVYPIKSCRGFTVRSSRVTRQGLDLDRNWMFVSTTNGKNKFVTIREYSELTLIDTALASISAAAAASVQPAQDEQDTTKHHREVKEDLQLVISIRNHPEKRVMIPARPTRAWLEAHTTCETVDIWGTETDGWVYGDEVNALVREELGQDVKLVYKGPTPRVLRGNGSPELLGRRESTNFPDVLPLLLANEASLRELNSRLRAKGEAEIGIERFRPNIVVRGDVAWSEDDWKQVRIVNGPAPSGALVVASPSTIDIDVSAHCARCQVPNVNPDTAEKNAHEPWNTLVSYRRIDEGIKWKPCFGMLSCPKNEGTVRVGMKMEVIETTKNHVYVKGF